MAETLTARGVKTAYEYDVLGRVVGVRAFAGGQTQPGRNVRLAYDQLGRLVFHTDGRTSGAFTYDALGRKLTETVDYGSFNKTNTYAWQANSQPASFTGPDGQAQTYAYDTAGRLTAMSVGASMVTLDNFTWTAPGSMTLPGGVRRHFGYDGLLRVTNINATSPTDALIQNYSYQYDDAGNIRQKVTEHGAYVYSYDGVDRLIGANNPTLADDGFTYDAVGNRLSSAAVSGSWLYNENNELLQAGNRTEYKYDAAGNLVEKKTPERTLLFEYDLDNHLSRVADHNNATVATYGYDFLRRRIWKEVRGTKTFYHYSNSGLVAEMDAAGTVTKSYGYKPNTPWGTDPLFVRENGKNYWYLNDHLGTPQQIVAENGGVVWKAQYAAFGKAEVDSGTTVTNNLRFPGQYYDEETGLHYNWNRYYDAESGRYSQVDPIENIYTDKSINIYSYAKNSPNIFIDWNGLYPSIQGVGIGWEVHFIYGYGRDTFYCCDGCYLWRIRTSKHCFGAGFAITGGATVQVTGLKSKRTCPDGYGGLTPEFGAGLVEYGTGVGKDGITNSIGLGRGIGFKATICYYRVIEKKIIGNCRI